MQKIALPAQWSAKAVSNFSQVPPEIQNREIPAQVPGCIHLDLLRENLIADPYLGENEWQTRWIGRTDWEFSCRFSLPPEALEEERVDLVCDGLDTVATIWVNGIEVGKSENMHVGARFNIKGALESIDTTARGDQNDRSDALTQPLGGTHTTTCVSANDHSVKATPPLGEGHNTTRVRANDHSDEATPALGEGQPQGRMRPSPRAEEATTEDGEGQNPTHELRIRFASPVNYARQKRDEIGDLPHASSYRDIDGECEPFHFIRKNACNFGWDWGPALTTSGIWKAISVEAWSVARIQSVRPIVRVANEKVAVVDVEVEIETTFTEEFHYGQRIDEEGRVWHVDYSGPMGIFLHANLGEGEETLSDNICFYPEPQDTHTFSFLIRQPNLWNPLGYGEQNTYSLSVDIDGEEAGKWQAKIGLRETKLDTSPDEIGAKWDICINGQKIWCKGANWIPDDVFLTRANDPKRLRERLTQAKDAGMNLIRVWGGGIYETDDFYDICDELGLLAWQDFPFACAAYSEDEDTAKQIEAEARFNIARLQKHPSLVIWNGCNENIWGFFDWGWPEKLNGRGWGGKYYFELLPKLVKELAPETPYWPGSPFSGSMEIHPLADAWGNKHMWDTWNEVSAENFRRYSPRFASEFGHQGPATFSTMTRAVGDERDPYGAAMLVHQKAADGNNKLHARLHEVFAPMERFDFDDWLYQTQLVQARAMKTAVEWFRTRHACSGALFWQLNDCWPVVSWAAIDGDGHEKPLYHAAKQFFAPRLLTIQPDGENLALWAHNDSDEEWLVNANIYSYGMDGEIDEYWGGTKICPPRQLVKVREIDRKSWREFQGYLCASNFHPSLQKTTERCFWFFDADKNLDYPQPKWSYELDGNTLSIRAETLLRDVCINADRFGGRVRENLVTLLPGETWSVEIEGVSSEELAKVDFSGRPIVYCANWFGRK